MSDDVDTWRENYYALLKRLNQHLGIPDGAPEVYLVDAFKSVLRQNKDYRRRIDTEGPPSVLEEQVVWKLSYERFLFVQSEGGKLIDLDLIRAVEAADRAVRGLRAVRKDAGE